MEIKIMKKIIALLICLLLLPAAVALADNAYLGGTTWELGMIAIIETDEYLDRDYIDANDLMITFRFEENGEVILTFHGNVFRGNYLLSGDYLEMDFQDDGNINTTITEGESGLLMFIFVNTFVEGQAHLFVLTEGTFGGTAPAAPDPDPAPAAPAPATPEPATPTPAVAEPQQPETPESDAPVTSQDVIELEGTTWEIVRAESPDGVLDRNDLVRIDYLIEFQFRRNGAVTCRVKNNSDWIEERGTYQLSGNTLSINIPSLPPMSTVIQNGSFMIPNFNNTGEDYTFRQSSSPSSASSGAMPRIVRDALVGGVIGAVAGGVVWLIRRKKKKPAEAAAMPHGMDPAMSHGTNQASPAYYPTPASAASAPATYAPGGAQHQLLCTSGPMSGATFPVIGSLRIGRDPSRCQIIFPADTAGISSLHCEIQPQQSGVLLIDHASTYGTFLLNGRKLNANESVILNPGDSFYLASNQNLFRVI